MTDRNQQENRENYIMKTFIIFNLHQTLLGRSNEGAGDRRGMWYAWGKKNQQFIKGVGEKNCMNETTWKTHRKMRG